MLRIQEKKDENGLDLYQIDPTANLTSPITFRSLVIEAVFFLTLK